MDYDAIIIGAGIGGLTAAFRLSEAGKKVLLLEKQLVPGGFATVFKRKGFTFESSVHCVDGLGKGGDIRNFLESSGLDKKVELIELDNFARVIYPEHDFVLDFEPEHFIEYLKNQFPQDKKGIILLFSIIDKFYAEFYHYAYSKIPEWLKMALTPFIYPHILEFSGITVQDFLEKHIKDEKCITLITDIWRFAGLPPERLSLFYFLLIFKGYYYERTAYVKGGFAKLFEAMANKIKENGSEVRFDIKAEKIISKEGRVQAVITDKGERINAKVVISNGNAIDALTNLIDDDKLKIEYNTQLSTLEKSISAVQVYLGLSCPAKELGMTHHIFSVNTAYNQNGHFEQSLAGDYDNCSLELVDHSQIDQTLVPQGKGSLLIMTLDSYFNWDKLSEAEYKVKKEELAEKFISRAEKYLPGLSKYVEVVEVATPLTIERYGSSPEGAIYGFAQTVKQSGINRLPQKTRIKGFFLAGGWTWPGAGLHPCFISGLTSADLALKFLK
ncbi:MAG: NAD(P)/FAD-dependent oxidoreductase [Candidatus Omnitrophota bacterium]